MTYYPVYGGLFILLIYKHTLFSVYSAWKDQYKQAEIYWNKYGTVDNSN